MKYFVKMFLSSPSGAPYMFERDELGNFRDWIFLRTLHPRNKGVAVVRDGMISFLPRRCRTLPRFFGT